MRKLLITIILRPSDPEQSADLRKFAMADDRLRLEAHLRDAADKWLRDNGFFIEAERS